MKKSDVKVGETYLVQVASNLVPVRIAREHDAGGWEGVSVKTGKTIRIKTAQRLRKRLDGPAKADATAADVGPHGQKAAKATQDTTAAPGRDTGERGAKRAAKADKPMSLLDAAAHLLSLGTGDPMRCKDIVELAVQRGLWQPRAGKTPANTLYAAILREINSKGEASRFVKAERGKFALKR